MLAKIKVGLYVLVALATLIVIFQNLTEVDVRLLFIKISMPQAVLLLATLLIGFLLGLAAKTIWKVLTWRAKSKPAAPAPTAGTSVEG